MVQAPVSENVIRLDSQLQSMLEAALGVENLPKG